MELKSLIYRERQIDIQLSDCAISDLHDIISAFRNIEVGHAKSVDELAVMLHPETVAPSEVQPSEDVGEGKPSAELEPCPPAVPTSAPPAAEKPAEPPAPSSATKSMNLKMCYPNEYADDVKQRLYDFSRRSMKEQFSIIKAVLSESGKPLTKRELAEKVFDTLLVQHFVDFVNQLTVSMAFYRKELTIASRVKDGFSKAKVACWALAKSSVPLARPSASPAAESAVAPSVIRSIFDQACSEHQRVISGGLLDNLAAHYHIPVGKLLEMVESDSDFKFILEKHGGRQVAVDGGQLLLLGEIVEDDET